MGTSTETTPSLEYALRQFEAAEANLTKLGQLWKEMQEFIPEGISFGSHEKYDHLCRVFSEVLKQLPAIDGWNPECHPLDLNEIAQGRLDAEEIMEISAKVHMEEAIEAPSRELAEYKFQLDRKRRGLIRDAVLGLMEQVGISLRELSKRVDFRSDVNQSKPVNDDQWEALKRSVQQIETLLGSSVSRPEGWHHLVRHLHFGLHCDLRDIVEQDWPVVEPNLARTFYGKEDPVPVDVKDLGELVASKPKGPVPTKLKWASLSPEDFERLVFMLIRSSPGYENPEWLTKTNAPDRGRDVSAFRVITDPLAGVIRHRLIIQCRHWLERSISMENVATLREQMTLWEPPRVDVCVIATSGRFATDTVAWIEKHNQSDSALRIEMWPESRLESLLASHPGLIAEFGLR